MDQQPFAIIACSQIQKDRVSFSDEFAIRKNKVIKSKAEGIAYYGISYVF